MQKIRKWLLYGFGLLCIVLAILKFSGVVDQNKHSSRTSTTDTAASKEAAPAPVQMVICNDSGASIVLMRDELQQVAQTKQKNLKKNLFASQCSRNAVSSDSVVEILQFMGAGDTEAQRQRRPFVFQVSLKDGSVGWVTAFDLPPRQWPTGGNWEAGRGTVGLLGIAAITIYEGNLWIKQNGAGDPATDYPTLRTLIGEHLTREQIMKWGKDAGETIYKQSGLY